MSDALDTGTRYELVVVIQRARFALFNVVIDLVEFSPVRRSLPAMLHTFLRYAPWSPHDSVVSCRYAEVSSAKARLRMR